MRILELEIINFGKFNHETVTFHDGMNLIYGENEMGKTTLHSFIRGMFFGIEKQRGRAARKDEYSIREPWFHAGQFAGIMRFESGGKIFRLERNFYRKEKSVSLVCETNGEVLSVEKGDLQVLMEGMNEDAFRNTVFFNQQSAATDEGLARELRNYMTNLQNSGDGEMNVSAAIKSLESQRRHLESEQKRLDAEQAEELESQQMRLEYVRQELLELSEEQKHCEVQMARIAKERIALQARLTEKKRSLEKMKRELDIPLEENAGKDEMESWKMRMEAGQDKRRMLWRNQELWLLGGGVLALLVCILVPHIWISALVLAGWLGISAIFVWKIYRRHQEEQERQERIQKRMQERMKKEIQAERERSAKREKLLEEKYDFLQGLYTEVAKGKERFNNQIIGYKDSFGKMYSVVKRLNSTLPEMVFYEAVDVCEEILGNSHVAIYSIKADSTFARLYVCSRRCTGSAEKSLKITDYPELLECLKNNETFFNRKALKNYPAYATPIRREGVLVGMLLIMEADYTQMNMEFSNKLRIMSDLIQDSLVRAMEFYEMGEKVIEDTRILEADKFEELLDVKKRMRRKQYSDYVLLEIEVKDDRKLNEISRRISGLVRENDVLGIGKDGKLCLLLSQTSSADMKAVAGRLLNSGIEFEQVRE